MSIAWFVVLVLGIVAIAMAVVHTEYKGSTFWYLTAFWASLVLAPLTAHFVG